MASLEHISMGKALGEMPSLVTSEFDYEVTDVRELVALDYYGSLSESDLAVILQEWREVSPCFIIDRVGFDNYLRQLAANQGLDVYDIEYLTGFYTSDVEYELSFDQARRLLALPVIFTKLEKNDFEMEGVLTDCVDALFYDAGLSLVQICQFIDISQPRFMHYRRQSMRHFPHEIALNLLHLWADFSLQRGYFVSDESQFYRDEVFVQRYVKEMRLSFYRTMADIVEITGIKKSRLQDLVGDPRVKKMSVGESKALFAAWEHLDRVVPVDERRLMHGDVQVTQDYVRDLINNFAISKAKIAKHIGVSGARISKFMRGELGGHITIGQSNAIKALHESAYTGEGEFALEVRKFRHDWSVTRCLLEELAEGGFGNTLVAERVGSTSLRISDFRAKKGHYQPMYWSEADGLVSMLLDLGERRRLEKVHGLDKIDSDFRFDKDSFKRFVDFVLERFDVDLLFLALSSGVPAETLRRLYSEKHFDVIFDDECVALWRTFLNLEMKLINK